MNDMRSPRIILAHPGRQHSFRTAIALKRAGVLHRYITTVYNRPRTFSLTRAATKLLSGDARVRAERRRVPELDDSDVTQFLEGLGLLLLLVYRIDSSRRLALRLEAYISRRFQRRVARYAIRHRVDAVIMYDTNASLCFAILERRAPDIVRIMDHAHPVRSHLHQVYDALSGTSGDFVRTFDASPFLLDASVAEHYAEEARAAQAHLVASSFSRMAVESTGVTADNIYLVPYGVDSTRFTPRRNHDESIPLRCLFVGEINQRKGVAQILQAARVLQAEPVEFVLIGSGREQHPSLYKPYEDCVTFLGRVSLETLLDSYASADVFVFPSLGEGFGLVVLEALSVGLPVIASTNCVGPDLIRDGWNGFVIPPGDTTSLVERIRWFAANRALLPEMSRAARETAEQHPWERYYEEMAIALRSIIPDSF